MYRAWARALKWCLSSILSSVPDPFPPIPKAMREGIQMKAANIFTILINFCEPTRLQHVSTSFMPRHEDMLTFNMMVLKLSCHPSVCRIITHTLSFYILLFLHHFLRKLFSASTDLTHCTNQSRASASSIRTGRSLRGPNQLAYAALPPYPLFVHYSPKSPPKKRKW